MRIAYLLLDGNVAGGQAVARQLMTGVRDAGHEPLAISPRRGPMIDLLEADEIPVDILPLDRSYRLDQAGRLAALLRRRRIDLLDTHTLFVGNHLSRAAGAIARVPVVAHVHAHEWFHPRPSVAMVQRRAEAATARLCAAIVTVSHDLERRLLDNGYPRDKVVVVHNGVAVPEHPLRPAGETLRVVCVARLAPSKGQHTLLRALAMTSGVAIDFVGDDLERGGAYRRELEGLAAQLGVTSRVRFLGYRSDVRDVLQSSHVLVLPSVLEGLPIVVLEAMANARAVIATAVGGTPELVDDEKTGLLVGWDDANGLANSLKRLRDEPSLTIRLGEAGRARVEREFTVSRMVEQTLSVYERSR
jgi:glycosyltransferase involved in cell wall biosynthesis